MIAVCLATVCKCKEVAKQLDCDHGTAGVGAMFCDGQKCLTCHKVPFPKSLLIQAIIKQMIINQQSTVEGKRRRG